MGIALLLSGSGCGSRAHDEIPPALLEAIAARESDAEQGDDYPPGPYGSQVGEIAQNVCFQAWSDPAAVDFDPERMEVTCLSDFWDPDGETRGLLLLNTAAIWCTACRVEYGGTGQRPSLGEEVAERFDDGFRILGSLFQDNEREAASSEDAVRWAETFEVDFPFGLDEQFVMGTFADESVQPFNMLVDTQTMEIVLILQGDEPGTLWPTVDAFLER